MAIQTISDVPNKNSKKPKAAKTRATGGLVLGPGRVLGSGAVIPASRVHRKTKISTAFTPRAPKPEKEADPDYKPDDEDIEKREERAGARRFDIRELTASKAKKSKESKESKTKGEDDTMDEDGEPKLGELEKSLPEEMEGKTRSGRSMNRGYRLGGNDE